MASTEKYVQFENPAFFKKILKSISYRIIESINYANFYNESMDEKTENIQDLKRIIKSLKQQNKDLAKYMNKENKSEEKNKEEKAKQSKKQEKSSKKAKQSKNKKSNNQSKEKDALAELKESLKKLRSELN